MAMILEYHGKYVALEELRVSCGVSRDGSKASNVRKAAENYGFLAKGFRKELDSFWDVELPVVVFWNFDHFLVVEGFKGDKVYLNDPASGRRTVRLSCKD